MATIKYNINNTLFSNAGGTVSSTGGSIKITGSNNYAIVPVGSVTDFATRLEEHLPNSSALSTSITDIQNSINQTKFDLQSAINTNLTVLQSKVDEANGVYTQFSEEYGSTINDYGSYQWWGLTLNNDGFITGAEIGSVNPTGNEQPQSYFKIAADSFIVGRSYEVNETPETVEIGGVEHELPYPTMWNYDPQLVSEPEPIPAFAISWNNEIKNYDIAFNGIVSFSNLVNGNGTTLINGGLVDTDKIIADKIILGATASARHIGSFPVIEDGVSYDSPTPEWITNTTNTIMRNIELRDGDSYYNIPEAQMFIYDTTSGEWVNTKGRDGESSSGFSIMLSNENYSIHRLYDGTWPSSNIETFLTIQYGMYDVIDSFDITLSNSDFKYDEADSRLYYDGPTFDINSKPAESVIVTATRSSSVVLALTNNTIISTTGTVEISGICPNGSTLELIDKNNNIIDTTVVGYSGTFLFTLVGLSDRVEDYIIMCTTGDGAKAVTKCKVTVDTEARGTVDVTGFTYIPDDTGTPENEEVKLCSISGSIEYGAIVQSLVISDGVNNVTVPVSMSGESFNEPNIDIVSLTGVITSNDIQISMTVVDSIGNTDVVAKGENTLVTAPVYDEVTLPIIAGTELVLKKEFRISSLEDGSSYSLNLRQSSVSLEPNGDIPSGATLDLDISRTVGNTTNTVAGSVTIELYVNGVISSTIGTYEVSVGGLSKLYTDLLNAGDTTQASSYELNVIAYVNSNEVDSQKIPIQWNAGSPYLIVLDNSVHVVPTDKDGAFGNYVGATTSATLYVGANEYTSGVAYSFTDTGNVTYTNNTTTGAVEVNSMSEDSAVITIAASVGGSQVATAKFSLAKAKEGIDGAAGNSYRLSMSPNILNLGAGDSSINVNVSARVIVSSHDGVDVLKTVTADYSEYASAEVRIYSGTSTSASYILDLKTATYKTVTSYKGVVYRCELYINGVYRDEVTVLTSKDGTSSNVEGPAGYDGCRGSIEIKDTYIFERADASTADIEFGTTIHYAKYGVNAWTNNVTMAVAIDNILNPPYRGDCPYTYVKGDTVSFVATKSGSGVNPTNDDTLYSAAATCTNNSTSISDTNWLNKVSLVVHGDAIIDGTLSVDKLIVGSGGADNEVTIVNGVLTANNVKASRLELTESVTDTNTSGIARRAIIGTTSDSNNGIAIYSNGTGSSGSVNSGACLHMYNVNASASFGVTLSSNISDTSDGQAGMYISMTGGATKVGFSTNGIINAGGGFTPFTGIHKSPTALTEVCVGDVVVDIPGTAKHESIMGATVECTTATSRLDKKVIGVIACVDESSNAHINALGEGLINVCSQNGDIEVGDYICSSDVRGKGMRQDDDLMHNYTVAKARESIVWDKLEEYEELDGYKWTKVACTYHCG